MESLILLTGIALTMDKAMTPNLPSHETCTIGIIGLGYVGLPLAVEFSKTKTCCRRGTTLKV